MKKQKNASSAKVVFRILKDTKPIAGWLVLGAFISLVSVALSLVTPEILRALSDRLYNYWEPAHLHQRRAGGERGHHLGQRRGHRHLYSQLRPLQQHRIRP